MDKTGGTRSSGRAPPHPPFSFSAFADMDVHAWNFSGAWLLEFSFNQIRIQSWLKSSRLCAFA